MSNREIAKDLGVSPRTVDRMMAAPKGKSSDLTQPIEADPSDPRQLDIEDAIREPSPADVARENLARMEKPEVREWHHALEALRRINARPSPAALFLDRYRGSGHAIAFKPQI